MNSHTENAYEKARFISSNASWTAGYIESSHFTLKTYLSPVRPASQSTPLIIYIEGDGYAWVNKNRVSPDPTPHTPFMLAVAVQDKTYESVYLARPCQYVILEGKGTNCRSSLWTDARFNEVVIADMSEAVSWVMEQKQKKKAILIAGSGGATVAALIAAQRNDIEGLVTLAGLLDHAEWTAFHKITPLGQSMNLPAYYNVLSRIKQLHLLGGKDKIIPPDLSIKAINLLKNGSQTQIDYRLIPNFDHQCCWVGYWKENHSKVVESLLNKK